MSKSLTVAALPGAPAAKPVNPLTAWWARQIGRRDTTGPAPDPTTGHLPYTQRMHARAAAGEAAVSQVLHQQVTRTDQAFIAVCAQIAHHHRAADLAAAAAAAVPAGAEPGTLLAAARSREVRRLRAETAAQQQAISDLTSRVTALLAERRHLINQARDLVHTHTARYHELVACHRRGYDRPGRRGTAPAGTPLPAYTPRAGWVDDDLPILIAAVDPATRDVVQWALREFDRPELAPARLHAV